jgi:hypothetical protein
VNCKSRKRSRASECALLVAIPLDREEFAEDVARRTDFVESYHIALGDPAKELWPAYERYARVCEDVAQTVASWGVRVIRRATAAAFFGAAARYAVVTLVAHARGPEITARDIADPAAIRSAFAAICRALGVPERPCPLTAHNMASFLDATLGPDEINEEEATLETTNFAWRASRYRTRWERRHIVERIVGAALAGGPAIEFHDGLADIDAVAAGLPRAIRTVDLTVCESVMLAERIRLNRTGGLILANPRPTTPDFRLAVYLEAMRFMTRHDTPYDEAVLRIRRALMRSS